MTAPTASGPGRGRPNLRRARERRGWSQNDLAGKPYIRGLDLGVSESDLGVDQRRISDELIVGDSLLDVGSNLGLLPVLLAERSSALTVVGCDNRADAVACGADLAQATGNDRVTFRLKDVLASDFGEIGRV